MLSWSWERKALSPSQPSGVLELPHARVEDEREFTCQAQHPLGSQNFSFSLSVQSESYAGSGGGLPGPVFGVWKGLGSGDRTSSPVPPSAGSPSACNCVTEKQESSWPLILILIRGGPPGGWLPPHLWPRLDLLQQVSGPVPLQGRLVTALSSRGG